MFINYISQANYRFDATDLNQLTLEAQTFNYNINVTGFLYFDGGYFFQHIEGDSEALIALYENIKNDTRHTILHDRLETKDSPRLFDNWSMRYIVRHELDTANLEQDVLNLMLNKPSPKTEAFWAKNIDSLLNSLSVALHA